MPKGRPRSEVILTEEEQKTLEEILRKHTTGQAIALRPNLCCLAHAGTIRRQNRQKKDMLPHMIES